MSTSIDEARQLRIDYWETVQAIAKEAKAEPDPDEYAIESVDGSEWVIYTYRNVALLQESPNDSAAFEEDDDPLAKCKSYCEVMARLAYSAMLADVRDAMAELPDANEPEEGA